MSDVGDLQRKHIKAAHNEGNIFDFYEWNTNVFTTTLAVLKSDRWLSPTGAYTKKFANLIYLNPNPQDVNYFDFKCGPFGVSKST